MKQLLTLAASILILASCTLADGDRMRTITVSIEPLRYFTEQIAGDRFRVTTMVPAGSNPEIFEPTARQLIDLSQSDLFIKVGQLGFELTWMKKLEQNAPHTIVIDASNGITPMTSINGIKDPHTWMSTTNAIQIAQNIYRALTTIDTKDSLYFKHNMENFVSRIHTLDTKIREQMTKDKSTAFLIYHPSLTYFANDYGLLQIPMEEDGREPSAAQLQKTIEKARSKRVKSFFIQREFGNRNTSTVTKATGASKIMINPLNYEWEQEMLSIAKKLK